MFNVHPIIYSRFRNSLRTIILSISLHQALTGRFIPILVIKGHRRFIVESINDRVHQCLRMNMVRVHRFFCSNMMISSLCFRRGIPIFIRHQSVTFTLRGDRSVLPSTLLNRRHKGHTRGRRRNRHGFLRTSSFFLILR